MAHPDEDRLNKIKAIMNSDEGDPHNQDDPYFQELLRSVVDEPSMLTAASDVVVSAARTLTAGPMSTEDLFATLMALYADGFTTGVLFERDGGTTRDGTTE